MTEFKWDGTRKIHFPQFGLFWYNLLLAEAETRYGIQWTCIWEERGIDWDTTPDETRTLRE